MSQSVLPARNSMLAAFLTAAAAVVLLLATQGGTAHAATCEGGKFCVWSGTFYNGEETNASCTTGSAWLNGLELKSAKNHCSVNVHIGWEEGGVTNWKACMAPGGERPEPGRFNRVLPGGC